MRVWGAGRHGAMQPVLVDVTTRDHAALPVILPVSHNPRVSEMGGQGKPPCRHGVAVWHRGVQAANGPVLGNEDRPAGQSCQIRIVLVHTKLANGARRVTVRIELVGEVVDAGLFVLHGEGEITTVAGVIHDLGSRTAERHVVALDLLEFLNAPELATAVIKFGRRNLPGILVIMIDDLADASQLNDLR